MKELPYFGGFSGVWFTRAAGRRCLAVMGVAVVASAGMTRLLRDEVALLPTEQSSRPERLVASLHYGGNLICHEQSGGLYLASGNNAIGQSRTEEVLRRSRIASEKHRR